MVNIMTRKCAKCKGEIEIGSNNITDVLKFQGKYYHSKCFEEMATQKAVSKRGKPQMWQEALDNIWEIEAETKKMLEQQIAKDNLNTYLLENYNITMIPSRFWQIVADLEIGKYKGKRCKPIGISVLYGCWKWGQHKLNEIARYNKSHNKGPADDNARLMYDLAILIGQVPQFLAYNDKQKVAEIERRKEIKESTKVDYSRIPNTKKGSDGFQDISSLVDDIF